MTEQDAVTAAQQRLVDVRLQAAKDIEAAQRELARAIGENQ